MGVDRPLDITQTSAKPSYRCSTNTTAWARTVGARRFPVGPTSASTISLDAFPPGKLWTFLPLATMTLV